MTRQRLTCLKPPLAPDTSSGWKPDAIRGSRHQRGYGAAWDRTRRRIFERDEGLCQECRRHGRVTPGTECDHLVPKSQGGDDSDANLEMKCQPCHAAKTAKETRGPA